MQTKIREELSTMSFEELQKLKEKLGTKVYNEAMFGKSKVKKKAFKRDNKNRYYILTRKFCKGILTANSYLVTNFTFF